MERLHIVVIGACNSGKSSLVNLLTGQATSLVASTAGTTTDPVRKLLELPHVGAAIVIDTPGLDDSTDLGPARVRMTEKALDEADIVIFITGENPAEEEKWLTTIQKRKIPVVEVVNKADIKSLEKAGAVKISALYGGKADREKLVEAILRALPEGYGATDLLRGLASDGDVVMLVMPQDGSAPTGRLILPQVQTLRALLDRKAMSVCVTPDRLQAALNSLVAPPKLIITDSQVFGQVAPLVPEGTALTSFSVLMAAMKGDIDYFVESVKVIRHLTADSKILIAEACTHVPQSEDIGRVKIPALLRRKAGADLKISYVNGKDFPDNLGEYDMVIHCGACMFNRSYVMARVAKAREQGVPMTNYGITLAYLTGILDKVKY